MSKRLSYEAGGNEDDYVKKCISCIHSYTRKDESDVLHYACKDGCTYAPRQSVAKK